MFSFLPWLAWFVHGASTAIAIAAVIRRDARAVPFAMSFVISVATASLYLPLWFFRAQRMDRLRGQIEEPVRTLQALIAATLLALALGLLLVMTTRLRRTPVLTRHAALAVVVIVNVGLLHLFWLVLMAPMPIGWRPAIRNRPDLLIPVRPCRGAVIWSYARNYVDIGTIDDLWLRFADPRNGNVPRFAISVSGHWYARYYWLTSSDYVSMRVRADDPAVIRCDSRTRRELVAPAAWHKLGVEE